MKSWFRVTLIVIIAIFAFLLSAYAQMKPGLWETTISIQPVGTVTSTICITEEDYLPTPMPQTDKDEKCKIVGKSTSGDTTTWKMECVEEGRKTTATGRITVKSDSAEGTIETTMEGESFVQHIKMKRIGNCNK